MANEFIIDDGSEVFDIKNLHGEVVGSVKLNLRDSNLVSRYEKTVDILKNDVMAYVQKEMEAGTDAEEVLKVAEKRVREAFDYLFNTNASEAFFSITGPFTIMANDDYYMSNVITVIGNRIKEVNEESQKRIKSKVDKYAAKYQTPAPAKKTTTRRKKAE